MLDRVTRGPLEAQRLLIPLPIDVSEPQAAMLEPLRPLVEEARWTSSPAAGKLLLASQAFYADWSPLHANAPYAVYHYTDAAALKGILESGRLWAADVLYLGGSWVVAQVPVMAQGAAAFVLLGILLRPLFIWVALLMAAAVPLMILVPVLAPEGIWLVALGVIAFLVLVWRRQERR